MRVLRLFRLLKLLKVVKAAYRRKNLSVELAERIESITLLSAFVKAHTASQVTLVKFLGRDGQVCTSEQARCLVESATCVAQAKALALCEADHVSAGILNSMDLINDCKRVVGGLSHFVMQAHESGVLSQRETETILHPLRERLRILAEELKDSEEGFTHTTDEETAVVLRLTQIANHHQKTSKEGKNSHGSSNGEKHAPHSGSSDRMEALAKFLHMSDDTANAAKNSAELDPPMMKEPTAETVDESADVPREPAGEVIPILTVPTGVGKQYGDQNIPNLQSIST